MEEPRVYLLSMRYLGARFEEMNRAGKSFDAVAAEVGISKQQVLALKDGGTVGIEVLDRLAETLEEGSIDALFAKAKRWYEHLPEDRREEVRAWAVATHLRRTAPKRGTGSTKEIERIGMGVRPKSAAKAPRKRTSKQ